MRTTRFWILSGIISLLILLTACVASTRAEGPSVTEASHAAETAKENGEESSTVKINVEVQGHTFTASMEENEAAAQLLEMMSEEPVVISMSDYAGFEKVGSLGTSLPTNNVQTTTQAGDIVLYNGNQIVIFYGSNSWSYTRLGKIDDLTGWKEALGSGDVTVKFSLISAAE